MAVTGQEENSHNPLPPFFKGEAGKGGIESSEGEGEVFMFLK
jgi:hypothetical protein